MKKTLFFLFLLLAVSGVHAQYSGGPVPTVPYFELPDDDGILSLSSTPFDPHGFVIGRDLHENKFADQDKGLRGMSEAYFNWADASDGTKQNFALCEELGLSVIISAQGKHYVGGDWMKMSDEEIETYVKEMIRQGGDSRSIIGYHICDEPSSVAFPKLAVAIAAVRKYAPGKLATINLYPNYATLWTLDQVHSQLGTRTYKEYLEKAATILKPDFLSYDNYMVQFSMDQRERSRMAQHYTNIMDVREIALKYNLPWHNVVSSNQIRYYTVIPTLDNMMLQAYTSLAAGCSGVRWFTYWQAGYDYAPINKQERRTETWYYQQEVNRRLTILGPMIQSLKSTGVYFTDPTIDPSLPLLPGDHVQGVECDEPLMIGEFLSANGNRYIMVVNISLERSARFIVNTKLPCERLFAISTGEMEPYFKEIISAEDRAAYTKGHNEEQLARSVERAHWLPAGQGVLIKCSGLQHDL